MGYRPTKRAGGNTRTQIQQAFQREGPRRAGEPPGPARNGREFDNGDDIGIRRVSGLSGFGRKNAVSVGRDEGYGPDAHAGLKVDLGLESHGKSTKLRGISRPA
jgi:hypothetical protein